MLLGAVTMETVKRCWAAVVLNCVTLQWISNGTGTRSRHRLHPVGEPGAREADRFPNDVGKHELVIGKPGDTEGAGKGRVSQPAHREPNTLWFGDSFRKIESKPGANSSRLENHGPEGARGVCVLASGL